MKTSTDRAPGAICSVTAMAQRLGLSRVRFYQLLKKGLFPQPLHTRTGRPYYPPDLQQQCLAVRQSGIGMDGHPVLFNNSRKRSKPGGPPDIAYEKLADALRGLRLKVTPGEIKEAVAVLYPQGLTKQSGEGEVIRDLFRHFTAEGRNGVQFL